MISTIYVKSTVFFPGNCYKELDSCHLTEMNMRVISISLCKFTTLIHFEIDISPFYLQQEIKITFHLLLLADDGIERKFAGIRRQMEQTTLNKILLMLRKKVMSFAEYVASV